MKKLSSNKLIKIITILLFLTLLAKFIGVVFLWILPSATEELQQKNIMLMPYRRVDFKNLIVAQQYHAKTIQKRKVVDASISDMVLHGLYGNGSYGYAIVSTLANPKKTEIISIGELYRGYRLKSIALNYVIFTKNNKEYILELDQSKSAPDKTRYVTPVQNSDGEQTLSVARKEINFYVENPAKIWQDISIQELKQNGEITGFKVTHIRKNSKMAGLGLKRGDIIIKANGIALTSYNAAVKLYQQWNKLESVSLIIRRGNEEKELIYEIH